MNTFDLRLDLDKSSAIQVVTLRQGDVDGTTVSATVYDHGALADLSGISSAYVEFALPDGTHYYRGSATVSGSVVTALVDESQAASVPGRACSAYFSLVDATTGSEYSTASFVVAVLRSAVDGMELAESWDNEIQAAIQACWDAAQGVTVADGTITTPKLATGAVTHDKLADAVRRGYVRSFETVADMQASTTLEAGMTCHTNGFHARGDGGAAYYTVGASGDIALQGGLYASEVKNSQYEVVDDYTSLLDSTAALVLVRNMGDGPFGINTSCLFEVTTAASSYIHRSDGTYMMACANQAPLMPANAPSVALGDCIASYVGRNTLSYGSPGMFDETVENNIDCSTFVQACLYGITYENSRYALGSSVENVLGQYVGDNYLKETTVGTRKHALTTWQMAEWFAEQKRLFKFPETGDYRDAINLLSFGDVIFSASDPNADRIYGIDHCMLVLKAFDDGHVLVAQGGGAGAPLVSDNQATVCKTSIVNFADYYGAGKPYQVFARPCYGGADDLPYNISGYAREVGPVASSAASGTPTVGRINCVEQLMPGRAYTLLVKGTLPSYEKMGSWLMGRVGTVNVLRAYHIDFSSDFVAIPFVMPVGTDIDSFMRLAAVEDTSTQTGYTYEVEECGIVRGIVNSGGMSHSVSVVKNDNNANVSSLSNYSYVDAAGRFHLIFDCVVNGTAGTTDESVIAYVQADKYPYPSGSAPAIKFPVFAGNITVFVGSYNQSNGAITLSRVNPTAGQVNATNRVNIVLDSFPYWT